MSTPKFAKTHNLVAFLEKPKQSNGFEEIIDFLNTSSVQYALTVNPTIYTTCIEQFWTSAKVKTVNGERQIQALVDKKKVIITETSIKSDLKLDDAEGTNCLPTATIFTELERISAKTTSWNEFSSTMASTIICLATNKNFNFSKYIFDNMVKNLEGGVKFLMYPRFMQVFQDKQVEGISRHKGIYVIPSHTKKVFANMKRPRNGFSGKVTPLFDIMMVQATKYMGEDSVAHTDSHSIPIYTQPSSSKPQKKKSRRKQRKDSGPTEPISDEAINEEHVATPSCDPPQSVLALETTKFNQALEIKSLKRRVKSLEKRRKSRTPGFKRLRKVGSASRVESSTNVSLGAQEDTSKQGRKIANLDADAEVTLVDETQEMNDDNLMFDTDVLEEQGKEVAEKEVSAVDPVTTAGEVITTANVEVTTANAPTITIDELTLAQTLIEIKAAKPKAAKDKGKAKIVEPEKPLKKKDQIAMDEEVELLEKRKKHFAALRAQEKRSKPPTKAQKRNTMSTYLKNMTGYKHNQLKSKSNDEVQEMFDKEMKRVNTFVDINTELVKSSETRIEGSSKRARDKLESDNSKKQKIDEHVKAKKDNDQEEAEMKKHIEIVKVTREDLETLWKLVKAKHGNTRPEDEYERVLWGDMK
ncbi:hypothetical protein Tco_0086788, partial [Tanacetum coccineum]